MLISAQWVNALEAVNVAIDAAGKYGSVRSQAGLGSALPREPAVNEGAGGRYSTVVAHRGGKAIAATSCPGDASLRPRRPPVR